MADAVFVAEVLSVTPAGANDTEERATLRVIRSWKGGKRPGDVVVLETPTANGYCRKSFSNDPPWAVIAEEDRPNADSTHRSPASTPAKLSDIWLIYASGPEPWALNWCGRSNPLNLPPALDDLEALNRLVPPNRRPK
jgi:hypothetical protein